MQDLLFDRIRDILLSQEILWEEKKMMGGITFMINDKMCFGSFQGGLLCRIDPAKRDEFLLESHVDIVKQGGREIKGYVHLLPPAYDSDQALLFWIDQCLEYNPKAKASKKKTKYKKEWFFFAFFSFFCINTTFFC